MPVEPIAPVPGPGGMVAQGRPAEAAESFSRLLKDVVAELGRTQETADVSITRLALGEPVDLHQVALEVEKASLAFQLALQVRNKMVEAYQEIMRMQV